MQCYKPYWVVVQLGLGLPGVQLGLGQLVPELDCSRVQLGLGHLGNVLLHILFPLGSSPVQLGLCSSVLLGNGMV